MQMECSFGKTVGNESEFFVYAVLEIKLLS